MKQDVETELKLQTAPLHAMVRGVSQAVRIANRGVCSEHGIFSTSCYR